MQTTLYLERSRSAVGQLAALDAQYKQFKGLVGQGLLAGLQASGLFDIGKAFTNSLIGTGPEIVNRLQLLGAKFREFTFDVARFLDELARKCVAFAFKNLIGPHLDQDFVKQALQQDWLPPESPKPLGK